jgi:hypothetical protein
MALTAAPATGPGELVVEHEPKTVLVGFADALAAPEAVFSLLAGGNRVVAFARSGTRPPLRRIQGIELIYIAAPEHDAARAIGDLRVAVRGCRAHALMPLDDASVWLCDELHPDVDVAIVGPTGATACITLDKRLQLGAAKHAGFAVPRTRIVRTVEELLALTDLPVALKPAQPIAEHDGRLVRGRNYVCADRAELCAAARTWAAAMPLLVQPLLTGVGEGLFGLAGPGGVQAWSAHRRVRMVNPQGSGSSACRTIHVDSELAAAAGRMLAQIGWRGLFMVELLRDTDGTPWFMELNGRSWGSMALARRCGLEYPAWALRQAFDETFRVSDPQRVAPRTCRHLGREIVHLLMVLRGPQSSAVTQWPSRCRTVREVLTFSRADEWYNAGSRRLFVEDTVKTVIDQLPAWRLPRWRRSA